MSFENVRAIGFDWDGTLVDSMGVKSRAFVESVIRFYPSLAARREDVERFYIETRGNPRFDQLKWLREKFGVEALADAQLDEWSDLFTSLYVDEKLPLFEGVVEVLPKLKQRGYKLFLNSSVPHEDLEKTLRLYPELEGMFEVILGTRERGKFRKGLLHLTEVAKQLGLGRNQLAFVGDAVDDVKAAHEAGSVAVRFADPQMERENTQAENPNIVVSALRELLTHFSPTLS